MPNPETFYLTEQEFRAQSTVPTLHKSLAQAEVVSLLLETMAEIDAYLGGGWEPLVDGQEFIFPRYQDTDDDGNPLIPRPVALATRLIADANLQMRAKGVLPHMVASEGKLGHSVTKHAKRAEPEQGTEHWPPKAFALLREFRRFGGLGMIQDTCFGDC